MEEIKYAEARLFVLNTQVDHPEMEKRVQRGNFIHYWGRRYMVKSIACHHRMVHIRPDGDLYIKDTFWKVNRQGILMKGTYSVLRYKCPQFGFIQQYHQFYRPTLSYSLN